MSFLGNTRLYGLVGLWDDITDGFSSVTDSTVELVKENPKTTIAIATIATGGAGVIAAPAIATTLGAAGVLGSTAGGTVISTLSGAALNSASLAALGGGAISAGGAGMVGGTCVVAGTTSLTTAAVGTAVKTGLES